MNSYSKLLETIDSLKADGVQPKVIKLKAKKPAKASLHYTK
tara:strand:- start:807 stop:929 length:123 start_codon:yes stop_codon:yes gene_type:complete